MEFFKKFQKGIDKALDIHSDDDSNPSDEVDRDTDSKIEEIEWNLDSPEDNIVVITEPNPVFDGHGNSDALLYLGSPNSSSPTDDHTDSHANKCDIGAPEHVDELSPDEHKQEVPDDALTIASSDIEILKIDQHSNFSQNNSINLCVANPPNPKLVDVYNTRLSELSEAKTKCENKIQILQKQNKMLTQRLEKSINNSKELAETEKQLKDLTKEAMKLSEINGKQNQEIKRLKTELQQMNVITAARDNALSQLQEAMSNNHVLTEEIKQLEEKLKEEQEFRQEMEDELNQDHNYEKKIAELIDENQNLKTEIKVLNNDINNIKNEMTEAKTSKFVSDNNLHQKLQEINGLTEEKERLEKSMKMLKDSNVDLNKRIEQYIEKERMKAEELATIQDPLLSRITELETKIKQCNIIEKEMSDKVRKLEYDANKYQKEKQEYEDRLNESASRFDYYKNQHEKSIIMVKFSKDFIYNVQHDCKKYLSTLLSLKKEIEELIKMRNNLYNLFSKAEIVIKNLLSEKEELLNDKNRLVKELQLATNNALKQATTSIVNIRQPEVIVEQQQTDFMFTDYTYADSVKSAIYQEYQDLRKRYDDALLELKQTNLKLSESLKELTVTKKLHEDLKGDYDRMLVEYGGRLEKIEALEEDIEDLRKLVKEQALKLSSSEAITTFDE